jgi:hypothetical protein
MARNGKETPGAGEDIVFVGLEALEPEADASELAGSASDDPGQDSPGDDAVLEQEELYEGLSSDELPSGKRDHP